MQQEKNGWKERLLAHSVFARKDQINKSNMEITPSDNPQVVYTNMLDLADELPDNTPRFILLSYPLTLVRTNYKKESFSSILPTYLL